MKSSSKIPRQRISLIGGVQEIVEPSPQKNGGRFVTKEFSYTRIVCRITPEVLLKANRAFLALNGQPNLEQKKARPGPRPNPARDILRELVRGKLGITLKEIRRLLADRKHRYQWEGLSPELSRLRRELLPEIVADFMVKNPQSTEKEVREFLATKHSYRSHDRRRQDRIREAIHDSRLKLTSS